MKETHIEIVKGVFSVFADYRDAKIEIAESEEYGSHLTINDGEFIIYQGHKLNVQSFHVIIFTEFSGSFYEPPSIEEHKLFTGYFPTAVMALAKHIYDGGMADAMLHADWLYDKLIQEGGQ